MSGLASLTAQYTDSEGEDDSAETSVLDKEMTRVFKAPPVAQLHLKTVGNDRSEKTPNGSTGPLVAYDGHDSDREDADLANRNDLDDDDDDPTRDRHGPIDMDIESQSSDQDSPRTSTVNVIRARSPQSFHRELLERGPLEPLLLPAEPAGKCTAELQSRINGLYEKARRGANLVESIQRKKSFRNPSIYEKLLVHCEIDELGSNFPPEIFDPHVFNKESYYEELSRRQTEAMNKLEKERKKPEVVNIVGVAPPTKKSKWDQTASGAAASSGAVRAAPPGLVAMPTGTKSVVIQGMGLLPKPKNPVTHVGTSVASRR